jgi:hypothetical protein
MMPLFRVTYDRWFRTREQNWDFREEEDLFHAASAEDAIASVRNGPSRVSRVAARAATQAEQDRHDEEVRNDP